MATNNKPTQDLEALVTFAHEAQEWIAAHILKRWTASMGSLGPAASHHGAACCAQTADDL